MASKLVVSSVHGALNLTRDAIGNLLSGQSPERAMAFMNQAGLILNALETALVSKDFRADKALEEALKNSYEALDKIDAKTPYNNDVADAALQKNVELMPLLTSIANPVSQE